MVKNYKREFLERFKVYFPISKHPQILKEDNMYKLKFLDTEIAISLEEGWAKDEIYESVLYKKGIGVLEGLNISATNKYIKEKALQRKQMIEIVENKDKNTELKRKIKKIANKTIESCEQAIKDAKIKKKDIDRVILVGGMTRMPYIRKLVENVFGIKPDTSVNPDEAVAKGAAIQAGIVSGSVKDTVLLDVIPMSLGIETVGGIFSKIVNKNTTIPFKQEETFTTSKDNQTEVSIKIYQGDNNLVKENVYLGEIVLNDIKPAPKNEPKIKVNFTTDTDGILKVYAEDEITKQIKEITINKK